MRISHYKTIVFSFLTAILAMSGVSQATEDFDRVRYGYEKVDGLDIFYREAGDPSTTKPALVLLHGFPSSSHQYRELLANLGDDFYLIAPDYPGYGDSSFPSKEEYTYTFDNIAETMDKFLIQRGLNRYVLMIQDFGAPMGLRIASKHPNRVAGLVVMNGNAYEEGIDRKGWGKVVDYWQERTPELEKHIIDNVFSLEGFKWQYTHGTRKPEAILPDNWNLDYMKMSRPGQHEIQLGMFYDYQNNIKKYPEWQQYLKTNQPPTLLVWGKNDAFFPVAGAEGYKRDLKDIDYNILDTGHFALEEEAPFITKKIREFMNKKFN
ncbi:alpha/beta fold hydrolase [Agaribacter flavus]|uniref:Alpha/beta fold hydrolase n=1 Tax=Agaribacter flavus TaxID=1902781 RepID=A0ABV7FKH3_9ALTE